MNTQERKAANRAAYDALRATYRALPVKTRKRIKDEFALQRVGNPVLSWTQFLTVALPIIQVSA